MKKSFKLFSLALIASAAAFVSAQAEELTVFDGTATNNSVPIEGYYYDTQGCAVQTIMPQAELSAMTGAFINSMTFYIANENGNVLNGGTLSVSVGTTEQTEFSSYGGSLIEGLTHVADITMTAGETQVVVEFDEPFAYTGGNLVIETSVATAGNYGYTYFYGQDAGVTNVFVKHSWTNSVDAFYPKTTFDYDLLEDKAAVSAQELAFGRLYPEQTAERTFTIKNLGKNPFTPVFAGVEAPFSITPAAAPIAAGEQVEYTVAFAPTAIGEYAQTLTIDCGVAGQFEIALTGAQVEIPAEVVVADGTVTSSYVPVYNGNYDSGDNLTQMIYSQDLMGELVGKKITAITFHTSAPLQALNGGSIQLSLKMVEQEAFAAAQAITEMTVVATAVPAIGESELVFSFSEPFEYTAGNLAVEALVTENGAYSFRDYFVGITKEAASFGYYKDFGSYESTVYNFLPKATFAYQKEDTPQPEVLRGDVNGDKNVSIADVTALIDILLSGDEAPAGADCNLDNNVSIADVTALIDYLLGGEWAN